MNFKIKNDQIINDLIGRKISFPKYTTQIMNLANQNSRGTAPEVVGKMSELFKQCPKGTYEFWRKWYLERKPTAIDDATEKIYAMIQNLASALSLIDKEMIRTWVYDLVITKTYWGLSFQESILKAISSRKGVAYRNSTPEEESKGIDGYVGDIAVSIKPTTYKAKSMLQENIEAKMIFYEKKKDGIAVEYNF